MKEIIFDLLSVGKSAKTFTINPEVKIKTSIVAAMVFSPRVKVSLLGGYVNLDSHQSVWGQRWNLSKF